MIFVAAFLLDIYNSREKNHLTICLYQDCTSFEIEENDYFGKSLSIIALVILFLYGPH